MCEPTVLMASHGFQELTGYHIEEIRGLTYRFLNNDCINNPEDLCCLRLALERGAPATTVLINRKKSGELFVNLLHVQRVSVAPRRDWGETLQYILGVQLDVTDLCDHEDNFDSLLHHMSPRVDDVVKSVTVQIAGALHGFLRFSNFPGKSYDISEPLQLQS